jgi:hypothetical protein
MIAGSFVSPQIKLNLDSYLNASPLSQPNGRFPMLDHTLFSAAALYTMRLKDEFCAFYLSGLHA